MGGGDRRGNKDEEDIMERELAEDAVWKRIQKNTFTRWANEHLKTVNKHVENLDTDFEDGIRLVALVEVLSGKRLPRYNKRPTVRAQKLANVSVAINFLINEEKIKIVNIDSIDVVDGRVKLILGLIWTLILHYSISMPMWEGEDDSLFQGKDPTPKQRLLAWVNSKIPDIPVTNLTTDWNDGKVLGALVDAIAPGLCPDWPDWKPEDALKNVTEVMQTAETHLNVPQLIRPEDLVNPKVDDLSMMTYLSQFPNAKLKQGAPLRSRTNPNRVRCYGPGIMPNGVVGGARTNFTVETFSAGQGNVEVFAQDPSGKMEPAEIKYNDDRGKTYTCSYTPKVQGPHKVIVKFAGSEVPKSPFTVNVSGEAGDASKVTASGPGLQKDGVSVGKPIHFDICTKGAGLGQVEVVILDSKGKPITAMSRIRQLDDDNYRCEYVAQDPGVHSVNIFYAGKPIKESPYGVRVSPACDPRKVRETGRGLQPKGVRVGDKADFKVLTDGAGEGKTEVKVLGPDGKEKKVNLKKVNDTTLECDYQPDEEGKYVVIVSFGEQEIFRSPFEVLVGPPKTSKIRAYGPGLEGGAVGHPACFTVDTNGETGTLGFTVEGPSEARIECKDNGDGSASVAYHPTAPGEYAIHVLSNGDDIPGSPYVAQIAEKSNFDPSKVQTTGPGIQATGVAQGKPTEFTVDASKAGEAPLDVSVMDNTYQKIPLKVEDKKNGSYHCLYKPETADKHVVQVNYGGVSVPGSPFKVQVSPPTDVSKVKVFGPGVEPGVKPGIPTHFNIDGAQAGPGPAKVTILDEKKKEIPVKIHEGPNNTYTIDCVVPSPGVYQVNVGYSGKNVAGFPLTLPVTPAADVSKVKVEGLHPTVYLDTPTDFTIDTSGLPKKTDAQIVCKITNPSGGKTDCVIGKAKNGVQTATFTPFEEGPHKVEVLVDGQPVDGSPFTVQAKKGCDPKRVKAYGPGLERGTINQTNTFTIETKGAGVGPLGLLIEGPAEAKMTCKDNRNGTCTVDYVPVEKGDYDIGVKYKGKHIPGSPFKVPVDIPVDPSKVKVSGPGVTPEMCRAGPPLTFKVDAKESGKTDLKVDISTPKGPSPFKPEIFDNNDGTYDVSYIPPPEGEQIDVAVSYGGNVPGSPFKMKVKPMTEPQNVKLSGPGLSKSVPASVPTEFTIDATNAGYGSPEVIIQAKDGSKCEAQVSRGPTPGTYRVAYTLSDVSEYTIKVLYGGKQVKGSSFTVKTTPTGQADKCKIVHPAKDQIDTEEEYCLLVQTQNPGQGSVTAKITKSKSEPAKQQGKTVTKKKVKETTDEEETEEEEVISVRVVDNKDGSYNVYYKILEPGDYTMDLKFGGQPIPNANYKFKAVASEEKKTRRKVIKEETYEEITTTTEYRQLQLYNVPIPPTVSDKRSAFVKMPSGKVDKPTIIDNHDGTISVKYDPKEEGLHELHIMYNNEPINGSPFKFFVDKLTSGAVTASGPGLTHGIAGEPCNFTIYTRGAGAGGLQVAIEGPSKAEITCHDNKDGTVSVQYLPPSPGEYKIIVKFSGRNIQGSPFISKITGEGRRRTQISVGHSSEVSLKVSEKDIKNLSATIMAPSGLEEVCIVKKLPNGHLGISFTPRECGEHTIHVKRMGEHINGSPFKINVLEREIGDASKVKVKGNSLKEGKTHMENEFTIDTKEAGFGGLNLSMEGPSKCVINCKEEKDETLKISYLPTEPGFYVINLKFADHHVPGSPFTVRVTGQGSNIQRENIKKQQEALPVTDVGSECKLTFKMPGTNAMDMSASVASPSGVTDDAEVIDLEDCLYAVHFVPKEVGIHTVSAKHKDAHITGSPFQFTVGPLREYGAHRVHAGGPGLERGVVNEPCEFNVWTREAGPGALSISVEGVSKADIDFKDRKDGSCLVSYKVKEPGEYQVGIKFNDQPIPDSPWKVWIMPQVNEAKKIELRAIPAESSLKPGSPVTIIINLNGVRGVLDAKVISPSGTEDDCFITPIDSDEHALRFIPKENGTHTLYIRFNGVHIKESPYRLRVGRDDADPAAVHAYGGGLKEVKSGAKAEFIVETSNAGHGRLSVSVDGPSKVSMDCTECEAGYKVRYTPLCPGEYYITVKYNGYHIVGSPFRVRCTGDKVVPVSDQESASVAVDTIEKGGGKQRAQNLPKFRSDAARVNSKGPGLKRAHVARSNTFTVNASQAGNNVLLAALYGPKGPCDDLSVKHLGGNVYNVTYSVKEKGDYVLIVKWGEEHIPGSPFKVEAN